MNHENKLSIYTIYKHPLDFPDKYVIRRFRVGGGLTVPTPDDKPSFVCDNLEEARKALPEGVIMFPRDPSDAETIIESWI